MTARSWISSDVLTMAMASVFLAPTFLAAQAPPAATTTAAKATAAKTSAANTKVWTVTRTPDGQPDLQGYWTSLSFTPMERSAKYGGKEFLTDAEVAEVYKAGVQHAYEVTYANSAEVPVYDSTVYALGAWQNGVQPNRRTSLVLTPPDGRIPPLTREAQRARAALRKIPTANENLEAQRTVQADGTEDLTLGVRCLSFGGPPILPAAYNSDVHIVQGSSYVMIEYEWNSEVRIIPLDGRPRLSQDIHRWHGDSRGRWEGNTLVVETTNFRPGATFQNANPKTLKITERFTRLDARTIE